MFLYLLRHAKSSAASAGQADHARALSVRGRGDADRIGELFALRRDTPRMALCSSARRTRETLARILDHMKGQPQVAIEDDLYLAECEALLSRVRDLPEGVDRVLVVGHNPGLAELARALATSGPDALREKLCRDFPTAALAILRLDAANWRDITRGARLEELLFPVDLESPRALMHSVGADPGLATSARVEPHPPARADDTPRPVGASVPKLPHNATLDDFWRATAASCFTQIVANTTPALAGVDPEGVHQMRVGVRRMRSLLRVLRPLLSREQTRPLEEGLRWLAGELGGVRDLDVFTLELLPRLSRAQCGVAALAQLADEARALHKKRAQDLRESLGSRRQARLIQRLRHFVSEPTWREHAIDKKPGPSSSATAFGDVVLTRLQGRVRKLGSAALLGSPTDRHRLRIALKQLRYASEFFRGFHRTKDERRYRRRLSQLQDLLGALNDTVTARCLVDELHSHADSGKAVASARGMGFVEGFAAREDELVLRALEAKWRHFERTPPFWPARRRVRAR